MMAARRSDHGLLDRLPPVRGRYAANAPLGSATWFRTGGAAEVMFRPADADDLAEFLARRPADVPLSFVGVGSNLLVRDGGVPGVTVRLGRGFVEVAVEGARVRAGAAALDANVALAACEASVAGLEFLSGIPGSIGGALRMNAGAFGREMKDVTISAVALDEKGGRHEIDAAGLGFSYRRCLAPEGWIFVSALLRGERGDRTEIAARIAEIRRTRDETQPQRAATGGSTFANPPGQKAWQLIDRAGCRGLRRGGAMVSEKHCNFLLNTGNATAADIEELGEDVRRRVEAETGVRLEWEIRRIGIPDVKGA
ncbi:MAG: UDP-N-acetylmuramate dehydrogenase [Alphaproteobacteria bacterium]|nr:UDP-N-acetylmuramate dehydrogenase [Alphaproteobacteria bacterium]